MYPQRLGLHVPRAGLNRREAPGKVTAMPRKCLGQLRTAFHMPSFQLCRSTGQKLKTYTIWQSALQRQWGDHIRRFVCG